MDLPSFRQGIGFAAFAEGWALYAERLAWELGWYEGSPYGHLGFLQAQAFHRLVLTNGSLPLELLETVVSNWLDAQTIE